MLLNPHAEAPELAPKVEDDPVEHVLTRFPGIDFVSACRLTEEIPEAELPGALDWLARSYVKPDGSIAGRDVQAIISAYEDDGEGWAREHSERRAEYHS